MSALARWLGYEHFELQSPLPLDECGRRLREAIEGDGDRFEHPPVIGHVHPPRFRIRKRLPPRSRNSFQTDLSGSLVETGASTRLACRTAPHPFVVVFMAIWFLMLLDFAISWFTTGLDGIGGRTVLPFETMIPVAMAVFGVGLVAFGRRMARGEKAYLVDFLCRATEAREIKNDAAASTRTVER